MSREQALYWLHDTSRPDETTIGRKAAVLGKLIHAGLPVPDGFCFAGKGRLDEPDLLWPMIEVAYRQLAMEGHPVVVRSSAAEEDSVSASFAGQYDTVLNVDSLDALRDAIRRCVASGQSNRLMAYQIGRASRPGVSRLAVLVQKQIDAQVSGVLFTCNPISGAAETLIEACVGLGDQLMAGRTSPTRYRVGPGRHVERLSGDALLTASQCFTLAALGKQIERILGTRQDVEWAIQAGKPFVLQARPITTRTPNQTASETWTRANVGEVLPDIVTPLTWSVFRETLLGRAGVAGGEGLEEMGLKCDLGRVHIRTDCMLDAFCYLPGVTPAVVSQVLGIEIPTRSGGYVAPSGLPVRLAQALFLLDALGCLNRLSWLIRRLPALHTVNSQVREMVAWTTSCFNLHRKCTAYAIGTFALIKRLLDRYLPGQALTALPAILMGNEELQTARQGLGLWQLARQVREHPALLTLVDSNMPWPAVEQATQVSAIGREFVAGFHALLGICGARAIGELELANPRWQEDPSFLLTTLRSLLHSAESDTLRDVLAAQRQQREQMAGSLEAKLPWPWRPVFRRLLISHARHVTLRENAKYLLMEGYAAIRHAVLELGDSLVARGLLSDRQDIFMCTVEELLELTNGRLTCNQQYERILVRRHDLDLWVGDHETDEANTTDQIAASHYLEGIGCSPGVAEGIARVLRDSSETEALQPGEILVTPHTDPGWTPLFLICKGIVTEIGGFLSHGATVAREYGIPAVVNVTHATSRIKTGDCVRVDGLNGRVTILHSCT